MARGTKPERRTLRFGRLSDILADADALHAAPARRTTGNWGDGEITDHVAHLIECSLDGFPVEAPLPLRLIGPPVLRWWGFERPWRPGLRLPGRMRALLPRPGTSWEDGLGRLRAAAARITAGERMTQRSPVAGSLVHEQWEQLHCRHAELHFSFIHPVGAAEPGAVGGTTT